MVFLGWLGHTHWTHPHQYVAVCCVWRLEEASLTDSDSVSYHAVCLATFSGVGRLKKGRGERGEGEGRGERGEGRGVSGEGKQQRKRKERREEGRKDIEKRKRKRRRKKKKMHNHAK